MGGAVLILLFVVVSFAIVMAGAAAYELTGVDRSTARFQALSAFTGTGFTTRVSEIVVRHPSRRRITTILIILGYAGTATSVASILGSIEPDDAALTIRNLTTVTVAVLLLALLLARLRPHLEGPILQFLRSRMKPDAVPHEELLLYKRDYGITRIEIPPDSRVNGKRLCDLDLRARRIQVLAVEEHNDVHPIPDPKWRFESGQHLIVYGRSEAVQGAFGPETSDAP